MTRTDAPTRYVSSPRPTFGSAARVAYADAVRHVWGDEESGEVPRGRPLRENLVQISKNPVGRAQNFTGTDQIQSQGHNESRADIHSIHRQVANYMRISRFSEITAGLHGVMTKRSHAYPMFSHNHEARRRIRQYARPSGLQPSQSFGQR